MADTLAVVQHIYSLASNPDNRESIVQDQGVLPGLVLFLDSDDTQVVRLVLKTLQLLCEYAPNRKAVAMEMGMLVSLKKLLQGQKFPFEREIRKRANALYCVLTRSNAPPQSPASSSSSQKPAASQKIHQAPATSQKFFIGGANKRAKTIILQIEGLEEQNKKLCEEAILKVRGVVSFTFNLPKKRCIVRVMDSVSAKSLCQTISDTKVLSAEQVVKNKSGEEVVLSFGRQPSIPDEERTDAEDMPDYLPEDDPVEESNMAVGRPGDKDSGSSGWFSGVSNFISNTLYW